ncbi:MAG: DcrB-related protein [Candidatus Methylumidiphilus sp.]|nr:DcrB-related protein [Pseudomonadota bacterium]
MPTYYTNELIFDLPEGLKDKTYHIFSISEDGPSEFNLVISRNPISNEETLESYGRRLKTEMEKALPNFKSHGCGIILVAGMPCWGLEYSWQNQAQWLHQRQVNLFHEVKSGQRQVLQITATVVGEFTQHWKDTFASVLGSLRMRPVEQP